MSQFDARNGDFEYVQCAVCERMIVRGRWFARLRSGDRMVALCGPLCMEMFEFRPQRYVRRIETLEGLRLPQARLSACR